MRQWEKEPIFTEKFPKFDPKDDVVLSTPLEKNQPEKAEVKVDAEVEILKDKKRSE